ncbi:MAG: cation:proton antiporter, partial [Desulfobulbaceae bacterium]|nr:cation:proton antiporter [Desulfobulbaceae bacterium]
MLLLAIESSCDETAAAVVRDGREVLSNLIASQVDLHAVYGGVVPELAARRHLEIINPLVDEALQQAGVKKEQLDGVVVTRGPGLIGALLVGLSFAFGAFVAGMVLSESDYGHQALSDIIPLRDLFGLLFFTSVGMLLDPRFLLANYAGVLQLVLLIAVGKGLMLAGIVRSFGYGNVVPLAVGLGMFQIGEFSFVLGQIGAA